MAASIPLGERSSFPGFQWQWRPPQVYGSVEAFEDYDDSVNKRIEEAYRQGKPFVLVKVGKRRSEPIEIFFADMVQHDPMTGSTYAVRRQGPQSLKFKAHRKFNECARILEQGSFQKKARMFRECDQEREEMLEDIDKRMVGVVDNYHERGAFACIARSSAFLVMGTLVVFLNVVWLGIDANYNEAQTVYDADWGFGAVENLFCAYFSFELFVRFGAFKRKCDCLRDAWMIFDLTLVLLMACEIWFIPLYFILTDSTDENAGRGGWAVLRCARMLKIARLGRLARIIRHCPELMAMCKAIFIAMRSVFFTMVMLAILVYVFAILFVTQLRGKTVITDEVKDFRTMHGAMWLLTIEGVLLDGPKDTLGVLVQHSYVMTGVFLVFIGLSAFTIVNMLIGILCNVVDQVSQTERDEADVAYLKNTLLELLECHDEDNDRSIRKDEFELLIRNPVTDLVLTRFGVDAADLLSMKENLFDDKGTHTKAVSKKHLSRSTSALGEEIAPQPCLSFAEFLRVVLRLRGGNSVKVTDMVDLREFIKQRLDTNREYVSQKLKLLESHILGESSLGLVDSLGPRNAARSPRLAVPEVIPEVNEQPVAATAQAELAGAPGVQEKQLFNSRGFNSAEGEQLFNLEDAIRSEQQLTMDSAQGQQLSDLRAGQQRLARRQAELENQQANWREAMVASQDRVSQQLLDVQKQLGQMCQVLAGRGQILPTQRFREIEDPHAPDHGWNPIQLNSSQTSGFFRRLTVNKCSENVEC